MPDLPTITLSDGNRIPQLGYGTFQIPPEATKEAVLLALEVGHRHIDTAQMYGNEAAVGEAVKTSGLTRDQLFITSKLNNPYHRPQDARAAFDATLEALGFDYIDLFLIHWPVPMHYNGDFVSTWQALQEFQRSGRARSIGVSNFEIPHLQKLIDAGEPMPAVNQIEAHPYLPNNEVRGFCRDHGIHVEAWAPIAKGRVLSDPAIKQVAERVDRTPAQVTLRWHVQRGDIVFPKSVTPARVRENFEIFDFQLSDVDMRTIDGLDRGESGRTGPHPNEMSRI